MNKQCIKCDFINLGTSKYCTSEFKPTITKEIGVVAHPEGATGAEDPPQASDFIEKKKTKTFSRFAWISLEMSIFWE